MQRPIFSIGLVVLALAAAVGSSQTFAQSRGEFPPFPELRDRDYPNDVEELRSRSEAGDGYATLRLYMERTCPKEVTLCESRLLDLLRLAVEQGESVAIPYLRIAELESGGTFTSEFGRATCGMTLDDLPDLSQSVTSLRFPVANYSRNEDESQSDFEEWQVEEIVGSEGSQGIMFNTSAVWIVFIFNEGDLRNVRISINLLALGGEAQGNAAVEIAKSVPMIVCPGWSGVDDAVESYLVGAARSWPPRGIHVEGEDAWLTVFGVMPDIMWIDLYTDPLHQPFESTFHESFDVSPDIYLRAYTSAPSADD